MNDSTPASGVWFPHWAEVLAKVRLKDLERRSYRLAIVEYLTFCKRSRQRATVASARLFMAQVEERRRLGKSQLAMWKGALNWFFHMAPSGGTPGGENLKSETLKSENRAGRPSSGGRILNTEHLTPDLSPHSSDERGEGAEMDAPATGCAWQKEPPLAAGDTGGPGWEQRLIRGRRGGHYGWGAGRGYGVVGGGVVG